MKKTFITLMIALMSVFASTTAFATTGTSVNDNAISTVMEIIKDITVKQTITLNDNSQLEIYYEKKGDVCKVYSTSNLKKYSANDLKRIKSTTFEITDRTEGKCYLTENTGDIVKMARNIFSKIR